MDEKAKARSRKGEQHGMAKLSDDKVLAIRAIYAAGGVSHRELAKHFGVTRQNISDIVARETWRHL